MVIIFMQPYNKSSPFQALSPVETLSGSSELLESIELVVFVQPVSDSQANKCDGVIALFLWLGSSLR